MNFSLLNKIKLILVCLGCLGVLVGIDFWLHRSSLFLKNGIEKPDQKVIFTYYFYWYDSKEGHSLDSKKDFLYHLPSSPTPSWHNTSWHKKQLLDMKDAGIDVLLPVYWGHDRTKERWSYEGLSYLSTAWKELEQDELSPPTIGMMFDTTIVDGRDLTTIPGQEFFYSNIHDFFTRIPEAAWARINNKPVIFLFTSRWTNAFDQSTFEYVYTHFQRDFGVKPYIIRESSWDYPHKTLQSKQVVTDYIKPISTENRYTWGGAHEGFIDTGGVISLGPGFDAHLIPGREKEKVASRENGEFYKKSLQQALSSSTSLLVIETWNEMHENTEICETIEFGRKYIDMTREFVDQWKKITPTP